MTPEEQAARNLVDEWMREDMRYGTEPLPSEQERLVKRIAAALRTAREEEREACIEAVRIAGMVGVDASALFYIAAIRARAQESEG